MLKLKLLGFIVSILLIGIILIRTPRANSGLDGFAAKSSSQRFLNLISTIGILIYFGIAVKLNLANQ